MHYESHERHQQVQSYENTIRLMSIIGIPSLQILTERFLEAGGSQEKYPTMHLLKMRSCHWITKIRHGFYFHSHHLSWTVPSGIISSSKTRACLLSLASDGEVVWA